jgi:hypothetical protein
LFTSLGQHLGLSAAYHAFGHAAEFEDHSDFLRAAAWQVIGRTIVIALCLPQSKMTDRFLDPQAAKFGRRQREAGEVATAAGDRVFFAAAPELRQRTRRIGNNLEILLDAGRKGGSISSATVYDVARKLDIEICALLGQLDELLSPGAPSSPAGPA